MSLRLCLVPGNQLRFFADDPWLKTHAMTGVPFRLEGVREAGSRLSIAILYCFGQPSERPP